MTHPTDMPLYASDTVTRTGYKRTRFDDVWRLVVGDTPSEQAS